MDGFNDEEIARAIALSLQEIPVAEPSPAPKKTAAIEYIEISDDEDEEGITNEAQFQAEVQQAVQASQKETPTTQTIPQQQPASSSNPFLLDRAQMERDRIARLKRLRPDADPNPAPNNDVEDEENESEAEGDGERSAKRQRVFSSSSSARDSNVGSSSAHPVAGSSKSQLKVAVKPSDPYFWDGELRQTANMHVDRDKDTQPVFRLTDILAPRDDIVFAIISAYCINFSWIYEFFNRNTPVIVVAQDPQGNETIKEVLPNWIKTTPFLRGGRGCMHMKFMLLFYNTGRLRVVVSTANLVEYDWRDIENTVWLQDFPLRPEPIPHDSKPNDFPATMTRILKAVNVAPALVSLLKNAHPNLPLQRMEDLRSKWDFSKVKVHLVPSLAGKHEGWPKVIKTGHPALMKAIRDIGARISKDKELMLECQGSSIGSYTTQWTNEFFCSARGDSAEDWLDQSRARRAKLPYPPLKMLFPTARTVRESVLGERGGGTMFCRRNQWEAANFPRHLFHDSKSKRGRVLMHSKMILATIRKSKFPSSSKSRMTPASDSETERGSDDEIVDTTPARDDLFGWAYVGSHNFTPSAWGTLSGSSFNPTLNVTNYELGIVFPLVKEEDADKVACWERPPKKYATGKDEPWIQSESPFFAETS